MPATKVFVWAWLAAFLAGCATAPSPEPRADTPAPETSPVLGVVLANLTSDDCRYNDLVFLMPRTQAQAALPQGWIARAQGSPETGGMVINLIDCGGGFAWSGADLFVLAQAPNNLPPQVEAFDAQNRTPRDPQKHLALDVYMLAAHTDHVLLRALFERASMTVAGGSVAKEPVAIPEASLARGSLEDANGTIITYAVSGVPFSSVIAHHRQWRETPEGLVLVERLMTNKDAPIDLYVGSSACTIRPGDFFATLVGRAECAPSLGQDIPIPFGWTGRAYLFPGVSVAAAK